jgi:uncharacterized protein
MQREVDRRSLAGALELRVSGGKKTLVGYAALYDSLSENLGGFVEVIRPGAFDRAIKEGQEVIARREHDSRLLLGRRTAGTLRVSSDAKGLRYEVDLADTGPARDTYTDVELGNLRGSSFAFVLPGPDAQRWGTSEDGTPLRELLDLDVIDVAPVATPAYPETTVSARAIEKAKEIEMEKAKLSEEALRQRALGHILARQEKREQSYEDRMNAIYAGLLKILGSPWESEGSWWMVEATFDDRVIVEKFNVSRQLWQYPVAFDADGVPSFGEPVKVEEQYVPVAAAEAARALSTATAAPVVDGTPAKADPDPAPPTEEPEPAVSPEVLRMRLELDRP